MGWKHVGITSRLGCMIANNRFSISVILAIGMLFVATISCNFRFDTREEVTLSYKEYYAIDPPALLESLAQNGEAFFIPIENEPDILPLDQQLPVDWTQADYMHIANVLFEDIWKETTNGWSLKSMSFSLDCTKIEHGIQEADLRYFRNDKTPEQEIRIERSIDIYAWRKSARVVEFIYTPRWVDWGSIDLAQMQISADDVLMLAENYGGKEKRLDVDNACDIDLLLSPDDPRYRGWHVRYDNRDGGQIFEAWIDPITGEVRD
jgi:hypothetical protein